jgi:PAS domain S-box-containing protein
MRIDASALRDLVEALPVGAALLDGELRLRAVSAPWERLTGASAGAQVGRSLPEALPRLAQLLEPLVGAALAGGGPVRRTPLGSASEGATRAAPLVASVVALGCAGAAARSLVVALEETPPTGARPAHATPADRPLERGPELLDAIVENLPNMIFVKDARDLRFVRFNRAGEELLGIERAELIGKSDRDFFPADEVEFFIRQDRQVLDGKVSVDIPEETIHTRSRGIRVLHTKKVPICDDEGVPIYLLGISEDVTELRRAEAFRLSDLLVRHIVDYAVFLLDGEGRVKTWNAGAERMTGFGSEEIVGGPFGRLLADAAGAESLLAEASARGHVDREEEWRHRSGRPIWTVTELTAIRAGEGPPVLFGAITRDISERKRAERERDELLHRQQEAVRARDEFLSIASHELRTPVATLKLQGELLEKAASQAVPDPGAPIHAQVARLARQTGRLERMIETLLDVSRLMGGQIRLERERVDLGELVAHVVGRFREERPDAPLRLEGAAGPTGCWDPLRLDQAVTNVVENALKYGGGRPVDVWVEGDDAVARVGVRDRGIGIDPAGLERIFDPFARAVSERQFGGLGMGLFIVKQLVEAHGGRVRVDSSPGRGTTVILEVPRHEPAHDPRGR